MRLAGAEERGGTIKDDLVCSCTSLLPHHAAFGAICVEVTFKTVPIGPGESANTMKVAVFELSTVRVAFPLPRSSTFKFTLLQSTALQSDIFWLGTQCVELL